MPILTFPSCPAFLMAVMRSSRPSMLSWMLGAKPPSSPTLVASVPYFFLMTSLRLWYTSAPSCMASLKFLAPVGRIMNSCIASLLPAWLPPLMTFMAGTGMTNLSVGLPARPAMYWYRGIFLAAAPARQMAIDTAKMAFAPSLDLDHPHSFLVPSSCSTIILSRPVWSVGSLPLRAGAMMLLTLSTALSTPLPSSRPLSLSRSSSAS
mmetsp:Transcript_54085/g.136066  ORF Transcript_54085/g.136066 Transcript_54085/m.136066 type:complete len:207 (-) Transcript_54085:244-864(-)